ncbi:unnamed protein product [Rotaria sordida]|uniref:Integrase catalytic domain-containing protein n=1 Tax=Rotaria sordida TaxID=392033 RepID=A0A814AYC5_9BILA|nr:unnamed protein product [Rotaria sordida]CAF1007366.1 unnamed protein product [Rotaria sordida]CAF3664191.1 unnamed protein product [Rotaria sordida]CAF3779788.1 unnamed protein product [Rotaria sordida]
MKILIDTGAQYSFINEKCLKFFNQYKFSDIGHQKFFMADGLTYFIVTGIIHLNINIGDIITSIPAFITKKLCTNLILGMDYLTKYDLDIQPKKKSILFKFDSQQIVIPINTETTLVDFPVKLSRSIKILPKSEQQIPVNVNISTAILSFRPSFNFIQKTSIYSPHASLNIKNYSTLLTVINPSNCPRYLRKGIIIGIATYNNPQSYSVANNENSIISNSFNSSSQKINTITIPPPLPTIQQTISNLLLHIVEQIQHDSIQSLLFKFQSTFDTSKYTVAQTKLSHVIETYPHTPPVSKCYPSNPTSIAEMRLIINKLLEAGLIRKSQSSYAAPALLVKKKDQTWRLVIDYKKLNSVTIKDNYPLPNMEVTLQTLDAGYRYFTKFDLKSGFWQFPIDEKDRYKTAFITPFGLFEWLVLPQGLRNSPPRHIITSTTVSPLPEKIKSIISLPEPRSLSEANRFIGALSWYRKFIFNFSSVAAPIHAITNLTKSNRHKFKWGPEQSKSFRELKQLLTSTPLFLNFPDDTQPVLLSTDASKVGLGGVLYQEINNVKKVLYYHSELLSPAQTRYHPIELEALAIFKCITRMKSFLLGRNIIIYTDNCPLCHMMQKKISNKHVDKISLLLQEFNIQQIIHVQGKYNCLPDYLSRHPIPSDDELLDYDYGLGFTKDKSSSSVQLIGAVVTRSKAKLMSRNIDSPPFSSQQQNSLNFSSLSSHDFNKLRDVNEHFDIIKLKEHQQNDSQIQKVIDDLKQRPNISFEYQNGILYKLLSYIREKIKRKLIYVPNSMLNALLFSYHDNPLVGGHFGVRRTLEKIRQQFWWPNMKNFIINYIKSCVVCQAYNVSRQKRPGFLQPITPPDGPNQLVGIDFCGPFPTTPQDNRYVLCLTDYYTKFITAIALPVCSASVTANAIFKEFICRYGVPKAIISDQGTSFKNQLMHSLSKLLGYHHIFCTPYHPQSNGQVERFNATFVTQLAKLTDAELNNWDEYLCSIVFAYNTGIHSTTNMSPFELTFGRKANLPIDHPPTSFIFPHPNDYFQQLVRNLELYRVTVKQNILKQQQQSKTRYDRHRKNPEYNIGTTVLIRNFTNRSKLDPRFSINTKIIIRKQHPIYWVEDINTKSVSQIHVNDLRPLMNN